MPQFLKSIYSIAALAVLTTIAVVNPPHSPRSSIRANAQASANAIAQIVHEVSRNENRFPELIKWAIQRTNEGMMKLQQGDLFAAEQELTRSIDLWEEIPTGKANRQDIARSYQQLQKALIARNQTYTALEVRDKWQARDTAELYRSIGSDSKALMPYNPLQRTVAEQRARSRKTTILVYSIVDRDLYTWTISPKGKTTFNQTSIPDGLNLEQIVGSINEKLRNRTNADAEMSKIAALLLPSITTALPPNNQPIAIVPPTELLSFPFAALKQASGKYLVETHPIAISPSLRSLIKVSPGNPAGGWQKPLIVGNPTMPEYPGTGKLPALPSAAAEAQEIGKIWTMKPLLGDEPTPTEITRRLKFAPVAHIASFILLEPKPDRPIGDIILANGWLNVGDLYKKRLNTRNLVLSGVMAKDMRSRQEGMMTLSQAGISSQIGSIVLNLWEFADSDPAARMLLMEFHRRLQARDSAPVALRQAVLATMKVYPQPQDWALFTVMD